MNEGRWYRLGPGSECREAAAPSGSHPKKRNWKKEKLIEDLLAADPGLLGEPFLIIDREREHRSVADLTALDQLGRMVVIEVKKKKTSDHQAAGQLIAYWAMTCQLSEAKIRDRHRKYREEAGLPSSTIEDAFEQQFGSATKLSFDPNRPRPRAFFVCPESDYKTRVVFNAITAAVGNDFEATIAWMRLWEKDDDSLVQIVVPAQTGTPTLEEKIRAGDVIESLDSDGKRYLVLDTDYQDEYLVERLSDLQDTLGPPHEPEGRGHIDHHRVVEDGRVSWGDHEEYERGCTLSRANKPGKEYTFFGADVRRGYFLRLKQGKKGPKLEWKPLAELGTKYRPAAAGDSP